MTVTAFATKHAMESYGYRFDAPGRSMSRADRQTMTTAQRLAGEVRVGLLDGLMGNASEVDPSKTQTEFAQILAPEERVDKAYQLIRDMFIFTNRRLIFVNRQGVTGSKVEYQSIPYKSITRFSVETAGHFDRDAELKIWLTGAPTPLQLQFNKKLNIYEVQAVLASYVLK